MSEPIIGPSRTHAASRVATPSRPSRRRDDARRVLLQRVLRFGAVLGVWRQRARDHASLQELGARQLRDIGLARHPEMTVGERALWRL